MDLVYMPEALSYGSLRHPQYRDYEQPWNKDYFNYGKSTTRGRNQFQKPSSLSASSSLSPTSSSSSKTGCLICKENKRRTLAAYIRGKARNNSCGEIHEEMEENDEDDEGEEEEERVAVKVGDEETRENKGEKKTTVISSTSISKGKEK